LSGGDRSADLRRCRKGAAGASRRCADDDGERGDPL